MNNLSPYSAILDDSGKKIRYNGNRVFHPIENVNETDFCEDMTKGRISKILRNQEYFHHLHKIDNGIFFGAVEYFRSIGAEWCNLPLTTLMISSPGEIYAIKDGICVAKDRISVPIGHK
jgi:hypothetical protein